MHVYVVILLTRKNQCGQADIAAEAGHWGTQARLGQLTTALGTRTRTGPCSGPHRFCRAVPTWQLARSVERGISGQAQPLQYLYMQADLHRASYKYDSLAYTLSILVLVLRTYTYLPARQREICAVLAMKSSLPLIRSNGAIVCRPSTAALAPGRCQERHRAAWHRPHVPSYPVRPTFCAECWVPLDLSDASKPDGATGGRGISS